MKNLQLLTLISLMLLPFPCLMAEAADEIAVEKLDQEELKEEEKAAVRSRDIEALREGKADVIEYTLDPSSVELFVEMDPGNYGFRTRDYRMVLSADFDLLLRGRSMLRYEYRFFDRISLGLMGGIDWSSLSLYSRFRDQLNKPYPKQFSVLGGLSGKWRITEWYMRSAVFLEPSLLFGYLWQDLAPLPRSTHWRLRPGIFAGYQTVFDSGLSLVLNLGAEFPIDFGQPNPIKEVVEPLFILGLGFAM